MVLIFKFCLTLIFPWETGEAVYAFKQANLESLLNSAPSPSRPADQTSEAGAHAAPSSSGPAAHPPPKRARLDVVSESGD
jgi:hypothetical protein